MKPNIKANPIKEFKEFIKHLDLCKKNSIGNNKNKNIDIGCDKKYGKYINIDGILIAVDCWNPNADIIFISHAHMDHIPNFPKNILKDENAQYSFPFFLCSEITKEISKIRTYGKFDFPESNWLLGKEQKFPQSIDYNGIKLTLILNGHTYGSTSLLIEGTKKIFVTSDFITSDRLFNDNRTPLFGLKPIKCDTLIVECTFGAPFFRFPPFLELKTRLNDYIQKQFLKGNPVILLGYIFGKSQILLNCLESFETIILDAKVAKLTKILEERGYKFSEWEPYGNYNKNILKEKKNYILIIPPNAMFNEPYKTLINYGAKVVYSSGKTISEKYRSKTPANLYLPLSDHCDHFNLIEFAKKCEPKKVYLEHGRIEEFSYFLKFNKYYCIDSFFL
ncbi:MAG: hypothetical protein ACTSPD_18580 [Promethearchaeota archaeon]